MDATDYLISFSYVETLIGTQLSNILHDTLKEITFNKNKYNKFNIERYQEALATYLSYFRFNSKDGEEDAEYCDLILEKSQSVKNLLLTKTKVIAFLRAGIVVLPRSIYIYCKSMNSDDYTEEELNK